MRTPFSYLAERYTLSPRALRMSTTASLIVSILLVFTGGVVRVTGSGLGCPTWPTCEGTSLAPTGELGIHGIIEFGNRLITGVIIAAVGWSIIAARLQKPRVRSMTRLAWSQFWLVVANAIAGGITVLTGLNPWVVALHFLMAVALLTTTALTWHRAHQTPNLSVPRHPLARRLSWALVATTLLLVAVGTLVSGSGPHSGDSADVARMPIDWTAITIVHGVLGVIVFIIAVWLWMVLRTDPTAPVARLRTSVFIGVFLAQGVIGTVQSFIGLPELLVAFHLLGAALVWVGALRVVLDVNPDLFPGRAPAETETLTARTPDRTRFAL